MLQGSSSLNLEEKCAAIFAPYNAYTLNLCGVHAAEVAHKSIFGNVQRVYNLFSGSPACWKILKETASVSLHGLSTQGGVQKSMPYVPLVKHHIKLLEVLSQIQTDV
jgi:hypothetical protein